MTILQRIELHKQGYSKEEINALAEEERAAAAQPEPEPEAAPQPEPEPAPTPAPAAAPQPDGTAQQLLSAINNLTNALTAQNFIRKEQPEAAQETTTDIFNNILKG